jgi:hypothetical protein
MDMLPGNHVSIPPPKNTVTNPLTDWATQLLSRHSAYTPYAHRAYSYTSTAYGYLNTARGYILPLIDQVSQKPDLATIALLLVILFVSLKLLNMLYQTLIFWIRMAWRLVFWGGLVVLGLWMYNRGPEGVGEDIQYWTEVWMQEREHWKNENVRVARVRMQQRAGVRDAWGGRF